jgi:hypothetical protein
MCLGEYDVGAAGCHFWFMDMWKHFARNDIKAIAMHTSTMTASAQLDLLRTIGLFTHPTYEYGVDWVFLGYIPGGETALAALHEDFPSIALADWEGTPASELPLLQGIQDYRDFDLAIANTWDFYKFARQWPSTPETPTIAMVPTWTWASARPFYPDTFKAMMHGTKGAGEYEILLGIPGRGIASADALTLSTLTWVGALIAAQVSVYIARGRVEEKARGGLA